MLEDGTGWKMKDDIVYRDGVAEFVVDGVYFGKGKGHVIGTRFINNSENDSYQIKVLQECVDHEEQKLKKRKREFLDIQPCEKGTPWYDIEKKDYSNETIAEIVIQIKKNNRDILATKKLTFEIDKEKKEYTLSIEDNDE